MIPRSSYACDGKLLARTRDMAPSPLQAVHRRETNCKLMFKEYRKVMLEVMFVDCQQTSIDKINVNCTKTSTNTRAIQALGTSCDV
jgi:hypothetical protein